MLPDPKQVKLAEWYEALKAAEAAKLVVATEQALRKEVAELFFPTPSEGVNSTPLAEGWALKYTYKIDRKLDEAALPAVKAKLQEMEVNTDVLVVMKPSLDTKAYKALVTLNPEGAKIFEQAMIIKPGSPTLELVAPKTAAPSGQ